MDAYRIFTNDPVNFPDAAFRSFVDLLHSKGQKLVLIIDPGIKIDPAGDCADDPEGALEAAVGMDCAAAIAAVSGSGGAGAAVCDFSLRVWLREELTMADVCSVSCNSCNGGSYETYEQLVEKGLYLRDEGGAPTIGKVWAGPSLFPDWLNPNTTRFWSEQVRTFHNKIPFDGLWIDMNEVANFCDGRCVVDTATELARYAEDENSLFSCECADTIEPNQFDEPAYSPFWYKNSNRDGQFAGSCRSAGADRSNGTTVDCGALSLATRHYPYNDEIYNEWNLHSLFGHMEAKATQEALRATRGQNVRTFVLTRSSFSGTGQFAARWNGDNHAEFDDMAMSIPGIITGGIFGFAMVGEDICGFGAPRDPSIMEELCTRWMQLGSWYPFARNHNAWHNPGHEPFRLGSMVLEASRQALNARMALTLYFYSLYHQAATVGGTVARPLSFEFPDDTSTWSIDTQFMVGPAFMVSPVLESGLDRVEIFFPGGDSGTVWYDYWTGRRVAVSDSRRLSVPAVLGTPMPVHVRGGQIVPRQAGALTTAATVVQPIDLLVSLDGKVDGAIQHMSAAGTDCSSMSQTSQSEVAARGYLYFDDGETVLDHARSDLVSFTATWSRAGGCGGDPPPINPSGFVLESTVQRADDSSVPEVATVTVLGVDCPPGDVTIDGEPAELTWFADVQKAVIQIDRSTLVSFHLEYQCGTWGQYAFQGVEGASGAQGALTFIENPHIEYGEFLPISPLVLTVTAMMDDDTFRVRVHDDNSARWSVPNRFRRLSSTVFFRIAEGAPFAFAGKCPTLSRIQCPRLLHHQMQERRI